MFFPNTFLSRVVQTDIGSCCSRQKKLQSGGYVETLCDPSQSCRKERWTLSPQWNHHTVICSLKACSKDMSFRQRYYSVWADIGKNDIDALRWGLWRESLAKAKWLKKFLNIISSLPDLDAFVQYHP